jgi:hypothetical protein
MFPFQNSGLTGQNFTFALITRQETACVFLFRESGHGGEEENKPSLAAITGSDGIRRWELHLADPPTIQCVV